MSTTTQVTYDGKRLIPALRLNYSRNFNQLENGEIIGQTYNIQFSSTICADKGSPNSSGNFWTADGYPSDEFISSEDRLSSIISKQKAILNLFSSTNLGKKFEVLPENDGEPIYFYPSTAEISFADGPWFNTCDYVISMTADRIYPNVDTSVPFNIDTASESWSIEPNEQPLSFNVPFTYRVSHSLSARGKKIYINGSGNTPYLEAKAWVASKIGIDRTILSGINNISNLGAYNHVLTENIDESDGGYSVNETWLFSSGNVIEDYNVSSQSNLEGLTIVSIDGNIQGLEARNLTNISGYRWVNASGYFNSIQNSLLNRAQTISQINLNPVAVSYNIGRNPLQGTISYNYEYNNRPVSYISGALTERISVSYNKKNKKHAQVPVIGRSRGPVLQGLGTSDATTKSLSIDFNLGPSLSGALNSAKFDFPYHLVSGLVEMLDPINNGAIKSYHSQPQENWEPITGQASFNIEWVYETNE